MVEVIILLIASMIGSGVLFSHQRWFTYFGTAGVLFELQWLLLTFVYRVLLWNISPLYVSITGSIIAVLIWGWLARTHWKRISIKSWWPDISVFTLLIVLLGASAVITSANTYRSDGSLLLHGFYNGDVATFTSLIEKSRSTSQLLEQNPFAANGYLEYPTLLHGATADLLSALHVSADLYKILPAMVFIQLLFTIPLFFLLWDILTPTPFSSEESWFGIRRRVLVYALQFIIVAYVVGLSFDTYTYPQSHFFLTGLYLLTAALLYKGYANTSSQQWLWITPAYLGICSLLFSNAITGTAALILGLMTAGGRIGDFGRPISERFVYVFLACVTLILFFVASPGDAPLGFLHFSYTAAIDMVRLAAPVILLLGISVFSFAEYPLASRFIVALSGAAFFMFFVSSRDIVVANASRFFYQAIIVTFPLLLLPVIRFLFLFRRHVFLSTTTLAYKTVSVAGVSAIVLLLLFPAGASMAGTVDSLLFQDIHYISPASVEALHWVQTNTDINDVFIVNPISDLTIPALTGKAIFRSDYWLSSEDNLLMMTKRAYEGDISAQQELITNHHADYLVIPFTHLPLWNDALVKKTPAFANNEITIFSLHE